MKLTVENLKAGYGDMEVLQGVSITVAPKTIVALVGPNGAGKSTLIKSIFTIAKVTDGTITLGETNLRGKQTHELLEAGIAYVNQGTIIFGDLTIAENLAIGVKQTTDPEDELKKLQEIYELFPNLKERENSHAYTLSGGQRQQLALGRALMSNPKILLLDEPSLGLSPKLQTEVFATLAKLRDKGLGILIVEQNAKKAIELADHTYVLEDGKVALEGGKSIVKDKKIQSIYLGGRY